MKKLFLLLIGVVLMAGTSFGYEFKKYPGICFSSMSPNGKLLIYSASDEGMVIVNTATGDTTVYVAGEDEDQIDGEEVNYSAGLGNVANDLGMIVGSVTNRDAGYWMDGKWTVLPFLEGVKKGLYTIGNGVSADGSVICGSVSTGSWMDDGGETSYFPAVWTKQSDGSYKCELLPYPTKDYTGRAPQYVTAICISDDGNTVVGQVRGYDGFATYPLVYTRDAEGKWSYKIYGLEYIAKSGVEFPAYPNYEPKMPQAEDFLTEEGKAAYEEAMELYNDSTELYYSNLIEDWPHYPQYSEYLSEDSLVAYNAAKDKYDVEYDVYADSVATFEEVYDEARTGASFVYNTLSMSANGVYFTQTLEREDPDADPFDWGSVGLDTPVLFDLSNGGETTEVEATTMQPTSVTNDGTMLVCSPAVEYSRQTYVVPKGASVPVPVLDWFSEKCDTASLWIKQNMAYDVTIYDYNYETDEEIVTTVEDSVMTGTMICNANGTIFCSYTYDQWTEDETNVGYTSYVIDITDPNNATGIVNIVRKGNDGNVNVTAASGKIVISGNVADAYVYDMSGRKVGSVSGNSTVDVNSGIYMVKVVGADGNVTTKKVSVGR